MNTKVQQVQELRRSSAASKHVPLPRKGSRGARKAAAISAQERSHA